MKQGYYKVEEYLVNKNIWKKLDLIAPYFVNVVTLFINNVLRIIIHTKLS
jgi:hypothetical protein